jgi:hypothetical protein
MYGNTLSKISLIFVGVVITICFLFFTGFRLPSPPDPTAGYQFFKEKNSTGVWVFEPETGTSKYFDIEKGMVVVNSFQMDSISVKTDAKMVRSKK